MKHWNRWGSTHTSYPLFESALNYLEDRLGNLPTVEDASLESVVKSVPPSGLTDHPLISTDPEIRLRHARGQSLPDWVALNTGRIPAFPDGVAFPDQESQLAELLEYAAHSRARVIPYGGGTSVVGHINPRPEDRPVLTISLEKMNRLLELDQDSGLATFQAGVTGPEIEARLAETGHTLGHFPQSFEYSTLGGWIATRSSGQQSYYFGRIENLFAGGWMETPRGSLILPAFPASAAGPDLRELVLGSEGRLGIITRAAVRVKSSPEKETFTGVFFPSWESGAAAVRKIARDQVPVSMLRLSDPQETETTLILSGKSWIDLADRGLRLIGLGSDRCLLILGLTGSTRQVRFARSQSLSICRGFGGLPVGSLAGKAWEKSRFTSPYLRNTLWDHGVAVDTLETALPWSKVIPASREIPQAIQQAARKAGQEALVMTHLSHIYPDGASIYTTYLFPRSADPDQLLATWLDMKNAASEQILKLEGTISHQHGVGVDHRDYLPAEKGPLGLQAIQQLTETFDPEGMLNPGKLIRRERI